MNRVAAASERPKPGGFNHSIQGLRGIAALTVMLCHFATDILDAHIHPVGSQFVPYLISGRHGVELFFMISGFLITQSMMRHANAAEFMKDRALRIYPAYIPVLLVIFLGGPFIHYDYFQGSVPADRSLQFLENVLFLPGVFSIRPALGVAWTLSWEAAFYIFSAITYTIWARHPRLGIWFGLAGSAALILIFPRFAFFSVGTFCYIYRGAIRTYAWPLGLASIPSIALFYTFCAWRRTYDDAGIINAAYVAVSVAAIAFGAVAFMSIANERGPLSAILRIRVFQVLGAISYSFYLWHTLVMTATKKLSFHLVGKLGEWGAIALFFVTSMALTVLVSWISYRLFEKAMSGWLSKRLKHGPAPASASAIP